MHPITKNLTPYFVLHLLNKGDCYGYEIITKLNQKNHLQLKKITVYKTLERLHDLKYIEYYYVTNDSSKGPRRKYYKITALGKEYLKQEETLIKKDQLALQEIKTIHNEVKIGTNIIHYDTVDSTNNVAKQFAMNQCIEGTCITATTQTNGRGRLNRQWVDQERNNLLLSIVLYPPLKIEAISSLTQVVAASLYETFKEYNVISKIKWPNDLLVNGKKIAGILIETSIHQQQCEYVIIGIGVNLTMNLSDLPIELSKKVTSLQQHTNQFINHDTFLNTLLKHLNSMYNAYLNGSLESIRICREHSYLIGKKAYIQKNNEVEIIGLTDLGELIVRNEQNQIETYVLNEITLEESYGEYNE